MKQLRVANPEAVFRTVQGEGRWAGTPSVFWRLSGCDLRCPWCDTPGQLEDFHPRLKTWAPKTTPTSQEWTKEIALVTIKANLEGYKHLVITGGEPMLQQDNIVDVFYGLKKPHGVWPYVTIETNCETAPRESFKLFVDLASLSPKLHRWKNHEVRKHIKAVYEEWVSVAPIVPAQLKIVAASRDDIFKAVDLILELRQLDDNLTWAAIQLESSWLQQEPWEGQSTHAITQLLAVHDIRLVAQMHPVLGLP